MADQNVTTSVWVPVGVALGGSSLLLSCLLFIIAPCCCYCSCCLCCPCNKKRGRAQLFVTRTKQNETHVEMSGGGVRMFVPPRLPEHPSSSTISTTASPHTPISATLCDHFPPIPNIETFPVSPTDSCSYVLPNNMTEANDSTDEQSTNWQKSESRSCLFTGGFQHLHNSSIQFISRNQAEQILQTQGTLGCYLFRKTSDNKVCLSALAERERRLVCRHLLLVETLKGEIKIDSLPDGSESFVCLEDLEQYYWGNSIHFQDGGLSLTLTVPCTFSM